MSNLKLWKAVEKTDPKHTKAANVRGNKITAIAPQYQIKNATEQFGSYGEKWGFKSFDFSYELFEKTGIIIFKGAFFFPGGEFPISTSISGYKDGACTKPDADFAKKAETDALTKALSKLGFNADVFMGLYDDVKYLQQVTEEFKEVDPVVADIAARANGNQSSWVKENWAGVIAQKWQSLDSVTISKLNILVNE